MEFAGEHLFIAVIFVIRIFIGRLSCFMEKVSLNASECYGIIQTDLHGHWLWLNAIEFMHNRMQMPHLFLIFVFFVHIKNS